MIYNWTKFNEKQEMDKFDFKSEYNSIINRIEKATTFLEVREVISDIKTFNKKAALGTKEEKALGDDLLKMYRQKSNDVIGK